MVEQLSSEGELNSSSGSMSSDFESVSLQFSQQEEDEEQPKDKNQAEESVRALKLIALDEEQQKNKLAKKNEKELFQEKMLLRSHSHKNDSKSPNKSPKEDLVSGFKLAVPNAIIASNHLNKYRSYGINSLAKSEKDKVNNPRRVVDSLSSIAESTHSVNQVSTPVVKEPSTKNMAQMMA